MTAAAWTAAPSLLSVARDLRTRSARGEPLVVLLIDGLGARMLERYAEAMPRLSSAWSEAGTPLARSCFPSTTVTCLPTLGRAAPPADHGFVGYSFRARVGGELGVVRPLHLPDAAPPLALGETEAGAAPPWRFVSATRLGSSFLSREAFPRATASHLGRRRNLGERIAALAAGRGTVLLYLDAVDTAGHRHGLGSRAQLRAMRRADRAFRELSALADEFTLVVLADHGMVPVGSWLRLEDFVSGDDLAAVAGEARAVHLYAREGREESLHRACSAIPGARAMRRSEAIGSALLDGVPSAGVAERLGDVTVTFEAPGSGLTWPGGPGERRAPAQHGGLSEAELLVPLLTVDGRA